MTPKRTGPPLSSQLRRLDPPAKVLLIKMEALKPPRTPQGLTVTILPYSRVEEMTEREFTEMAESHDCILLDPRLGDGDLFWEALSDSLQRQLGDVASRLLLSQIREAEEAQIDQRRLWEAVGGLLGDGATQLRVATLRRLRHTLTKGSNVG